LVKWSSKKQKSGKISHFTDEKKKTIVSGDSPGDHQSLSDADDLKEAQEFGEQRKKEFDADEEDDGELGDDFKKKTILIGKGKDGEAVTLEIDFDGDYFSISWNKKARWVKMQLVQELKRL